MDKKYVAISRNEGVTDDNLENLRETIKKGLLDSPNKKYVIYEAIEEMSADIKINSKSWGDKNSDRAHDLLPLPENILAPPKGFAYIGYGDQVRGHQTRLMIYLDRGGWTSEGMCGGGCSFHYATRIENLHLEIDHRENS